MQFPIVIVGALVGRMIENMKLFSSPQKRSKSEEPVRKVYLYSAVSQNWVLGTPAYYLVVIENLTVFEHCENWNFKKSLLYFPRSYRDENRNNSYSAVVLSLKLIEQCYHGARGCVFSPHFHLLHINIRKNKFWFSENWTAKKKVLFLLFAFNVLGRRMNSTNPRVGPRDFFFPVPRDTLFERHASWHRYTLSESLLSLLIKKMPRSLGYRVHFFELLCPL